MAWGRSPSDSSRTDDPREACCSCARPGSRLPWWASGRARRFRFSHSPSVPSGFSPGSTTPRDCRSSRASSRSRAEEWAGTGWAGASGLPRARRSSGRRWRSAGPGGPWPASSSSRVWSRSCCSSSGHSPSSSPLRPSVQTGLHAPSGAARSRSSCSYMFAGFTYQGGLTFLPRFVGAGFFALALALGAIGQVVSGRLADRRHSERILFGLSVGAATILVLLAVLPPGGAFTTAALLFGFLLFSLEPLQNILVTGEVPGPLRGLAFGFTFLSVFGIGSLGAALAGWLIANHASAILFLVLGGFLAASGTASLGVRRRFNA